MIVGLKMKKPPAFVVSDGEWMGVEFAVDQWRVLGGTLFIRQIWKIYVPEFPGCKTAL
jgi:hypothetical protein